MKKFTLLASVLLGVTIAVNAQTPATTKVSKQVKVLDWLNTAVVDGNQVEGGLHSYNLWSDVLTTGTPKLKTAEVKLGMLITISGETDPNLNGTFRLKVWAGGASTPAVLPTQGEWERTGDVIIVADMDARDGLIVTDDTKPGLAIGTTVLVGKNILGDPQTFIYAGGKFDANGDGTVDATDVWFSFGDNSNSSGYIYTGSVDPTAVDPFTGDFTTVTLTDGFINDGTGKTTTKAGINAASDKKLNSLTPATITLASDANVPVIAFPKAWAKPNFLLSSASGYSQLQDCWTVHYIVKDNIPYQVWVADIAFANGSTGLSLIVQ